MASIGIAALAVAAVLVTTDLVRPDHSAPRLAGANNRTDSSALPQIRTLSELQPPRPLSHDDPLRLWVGGDSLSGSAGPALGEIAGDTGIVKTQVDYKVSSGIASDAVRDWPERAAADMAAYDPEAVVFIIGTNDAPIVSSHRNDDGVYEWEPGYRMRVAQMMDLFVGGEEHRTVIWVGAPTMATAWRDKGVVELNRVMREEADRRDEVVYLDAYSLFAGSDGRYAASLRDDDGDLVRMRNGDGVHFTAAGAERLARAAYALLDARWNIDDQAVPDQPIEYSMVGNGELGRTRSYSGGSSTGTATTASTAPPATEAPATTAPPTSAPAVATTTTSAPAATTTAPPATTTTAAPTTTVAEASAEP